MTLDNGADRAAADRLLHRLKRDGPMTASQLATKLAISHEAVRQQLGRLKQGGWVGAGRQRGAVGRPARLWTLQPKAEGLFADAHAELAVRLIEAVRQLGWQWMLLNQPPGLEE